MKCKLLVAEDELIERKVLCRTLQKYLGDLISLYEAKNGREALEIFSREAPQVAVLRRVVVMDCGDGLIEMVNPEILETEGEQDGPEGCLSVPGRRGMVKRPMKVRAKFQDRNGEWYEIEAEELLARCIMHETDHLDGQLYVDIMSRELFDEDDGEETEE